MINNKLIYFNRYQNYDTAYKNNQIADSSIVFVEDRKSIFTHGHEFGVGGNIDINSVVMSYLSDYYKKQEIDVRLSQKQNVLTNSTVLATINGQSLYFNGNITIPTSSDYESGIGISILNDIINLKAASTSEIGGIRLGFSAGNNNYPVQVDGSSRAYVHVPTTGGGEQGEPGTDGGYYEIIFKTTAAGETVTAPADFENNPNGWSHSAANTYGTNNVVWMTMRFIDGNGNAGEWRQPWCITGPKGDAGADGDTFEYIYARTTTESSTSLDNPNSGIKSVAFKEDGVTPMSAGNTPANDDFVPAGWTDSPRGITNVYKYEWMCMRKRTDGVWGQFYGPVLWSAYGRLGADGDGVEYIYYAVNGATYANNPQNWTTDANFLNREYIRSGSGWTDNPVDLSGTLLGPGSKQWVSVRKKYSDSVGQAPYWHAYSEPALWSYYALDGDAGIGVVADFDNDMMAVSMKDTGYNYAFEQETTIHLYNGVQELVPSEDPTIISAVDSLGNSISDSYFSVNTGTSTVHVEIPADAINLETVGTIFVTVQITSSVNDAPVTRQATLQIVGFRFGTNGEDGSTYSLGVSHRVIKKYANGLKSPNSIQPWCVVTEGSSIIDTWYPTDIVSNSTTKWDSNHYLDIRYKIDDGVERVLTDGDSISVSSVADQIKFSLVYHANTSQYVIDLEVVYVISDGTDGVPATTYEIIPVSSTLRKQKYTSSYQLTGTIYFDIVKITGSTRTLVTTFGQSAAPIYARVRLNNTSTIMDGPTMSNGHWKVNDIFPWNDNYNCAIIEILDSNTANAGVLASCVIPTIIPGDKGEDADIQSLNLKVPRFRTYVANPSPAWNNGEQRESDGVNYVDIVIYGNSYYRCLRYGTTDTPSFSTTNGWELMSASGSAAFEYLLADCAIFKTLSSNQIILMGNTDENDPNQQAPVAGLITGKYIPYELSGSQSTPNTNGIRIFAGTVPAGGNFANTAFTVDQEGKVTAGKGSIVFNSNGSGQLANGNISWDRFGAITAKEFNLSVLDFNGYDNIGTTPGASYNHIFIDNIIINKPYNTGYMTFDYIIFKGGILIGKDTAVVPFPQVNVVSAIANRYNISNAYGLLFYLLEHIKYLGPGAGYPASFTISLIKDMYTVHMNPEVAYYLKLSNSGAITISPSSQGNGTQLKFPTDSNTYEKTYGEIYYGYPINTGVASWGYVKLSDIYAINHLTESIGNPSLHYYTYDRVLVPVPENMTIQDPQVAPVSSDIVSL